MVAESNLLETTPQSTKGGSLSKPYIWPQSWPLKSKKRGHRLGLKLTPLSTQPLRALSEHEPKESELQEFRTSLVVQWLRL